MFKKLLALNTAQFRVSFLYYVGNFLLNFFRYLFHLVLLRFLLPSEYGEFLSYLSLIYLLTIPSGTVANLVTKYVASYKAKGDRDTLNIFFQYLIKKTAPVSLFIGLLLIFLSTPLAVLFKAHPLAFIILGISAFITLFQTITSSFLVGYQKFIPQIALGFLNTFLTIIFSLIFIKIGFGATGAVIGQILSGILITLITLYYLKDVLFPFITFTKKPNFSLKNFTFYSFIYSLGTLSLISVDILVARIIFDPHTSGLYSSLSILGRMILFGLTPIISLVLPMVTLRYSQKSSSRSIFIKLGASILGLGLIGALIFTLFPTIIISKLSGIQYLSMQHLLSPFAFGMVFFAISQFILSFLMATGKENSNYVLIFFASLQPIILYLFGHNLNLFVWLNTVLYLALLLSLFGFVYYDRKTRIKFTHDT